MTVAWICVNSIELTYEDQSAGVQERRVETMDMTGLAYQFLKRLQLTIRLEE